MRRIYIFISLILIGPALGTFAGVNIKNGNYYCKFTDVICSGSLMNLKIDRTYNSKVADAGWFGSGWSSELETCLHTMPGGGVAIHWFGYQWTYYKPQQDWDMNEINVAVDRIVELEKESGNVNTPDEILKLRNQILNSMDLRYAYWKKYLVRGKFQEYQMNPGTRLFIVSGTFNQVLVTDNGFYSVNPIDSTEYFFNKSGKLIRKADRSGNFIAFSYDDAGMIRYVSDSDSNLLTFTCDGNGRVLKIEDQNNRHAEYRYDGNRNLIYSKDTDINEFRYTYDSQNCMTSTSYPDGTKVEMEYDKGLFCRRFKDRDGSSREYDYFINSELDYGTRITQKDQHDSVTGTKLYWYTYIKNEVGKTYLRSYMFVTNDVDTLKQVMNDMSMIESLVHNDTIWNYEYSVKGGLARVTDNRGHWTEPEKTAQGLSKITDQQGWLVFNYDQDGKPLSVKTSDGLEIPYPYPADRPELSATISRIRHDLRIISYGMIYGVVNQWM